MFEIKEKEWLEVLQQLNELDEDYKRINLWDLVNFCVENKKTRYAAEDFLKNYNKSKPKDNALALQAKEKGNENCRKKNYQESLSLYTKSILFADKNYEGLSLAYSNRSVVLQRMGHLLESLSDIDMALASGYPKEKSEMLMLRKSRCLVQLGDVEKAKEVLEDVLKNSDKKDCCQLIKNELKKIRNLKNKEIPNSELKLPELLGGENKNFVSASKHLSVYYDKVKGRHVIANEDLEIGDVLLVEKPFAYVVFENCSNCAKSTLAPIPCWNCLDVVYCSPKCRDDFWKSVHSFECGFAELFNKIGISYLSLRVILRASSSLDELKKVLSTISEPKYDNGIVACKSNAYDAVYNLVHHTEKYEISELFQYVMTSLLLALYLKNYTNYFSKLSESNDLNLLTSVICRHTLQLICNGYVIRDVLNKWTDLCPTSVTKTLKKGTAIYVSASMMNHSCESSTWNFFHGNWLIVRAAKAIKKGEEVFSCYGYQASTTKRFVRQEMLRSQYFFECKCQRCLQTVDIQDRLQAFKCIYCKGPSILKTECFPSLMCVDCGRISKFSEEMKTKMDNLWPLIEGVKVLCTDDVTLILKNFLQAWWISRDIFYKFHIDLLYAAEKVAQCLYLLGDFRRCILFLKCCIVSIEERFGSVSIYLASELEYLGDIIHLYVINGTENSSSELIRQGMQYYQKAEKIFTLLCGADYKKIKRIKVREGNLERMLQR